MYFGHMCQETKKDILMSFCMGSIGHVMATVLIKTWLNNIKENPSYLGI